MTGKVIVIEGTDCSGKETQSKILVERLNKEGEKTFYYGFPNYKSPTGKIVGYPYLGKAWIAAEIVDEHRETIKEKLKELYEIKYPEEKYDSKLVDRAIDVISGELGNGWFLETAPKVDPKVSALLYATDRAYNKKILEDYLKEGNLVIDRYIYSSMGHQGGKYKNAQDRAAYYDFIKTLEYDLVGLPVSDIRLFLHMPPAYSQMLNDLRGEKKDQNERDPEHLKNAEISFLDLARIYKFETIECLKQQSAVAKLEDIKQPEEIHEEVYDIVSRKLNLR